jgi:hypothetical protein
MNDTTIRSGIPQSQPAEGPPPATVVALRAAFAALGELPEEALDDEGLLQVAAEWERIRARADAGQLAALAGVAAGRPSPRPGARRQRGGVTLRPHMPRTPDTPEGRDVPTRRVARADSLVVA